jgi:hypothetical protein
MFKFHHLLWCAVYSKCAIFSGSRFLFIKGTWFFFSKTITIKEISRKGSMPFSSNWLLTCSNFSDYPFNTVVMILKKSCSLFLLWGSDKVRDNQKNCLRCCGQYSKIKFTLILNLPMKKCTVQLRWLIRPLYNQPPSVAIVTKQTLLAWKRPIKPEASLAYQPPT